MVEEYSSATRLVLALEADRVLALTRVEGSSLRVGGAYAVDREP